MKQQRVEHLNRRINTMMKIIMKAQEAFLIVEYLLKPDDDDEKSYEKTLNTFIHYSRIAYWQLTIIELAKLYLDREKFSISSLLNSLKKDGEFSELKIPSDQIVGWETKIASEKTFIENLKQQRDKTYAHEHGSEDIDNIIPMNKIKELFEITYEIMHTLGKHLGNPHHMFQVINSPADSLKNMIERLAKQSKYEQNKLKNVAKEYGLENELPAEE